MEIKSIFDWLNAITYYKPSAESFSDEDWEKWNSYMVNRFISMEPNYLELVNYAQTIPYDNKKQLYNLYKEMIPKRKMFFKYLKPSKGVKSKELYSHFCDYFECSVREADDYIKILKKKDVKAILKSRGLDDKEITKLMKV